MRPDRRYRFYPQYFDKNLSRGQGRRLSSKHAIENPKLLEIKIAAQQLGYEVEVDQNKIYSRHWSSASKGMLFLNTNSDQIPKTKLIGNLSKTITDFARPLLIDEQKKRRMEKEKSTKKTVSKRVTKDVRSKGQSRRLRRR